MKKDWRDNGIKFRCIIEMLGAPKEHIETTLKDYVKSLKDNENLTVVKSNYAEAEPQGRLFSTFAELDIWIKDIPSLFGFCIDSLPSSIEILEPEEMNLQSKDFADLLNDLQAKLHALDMGLKNMNAKIQMLDTNSKVLAANLIGLALKDGPKAESELESLTGIPKPKLGEFLEELSTEGRVEKDGDLYKAK